MEEPDFYGRYEDLKKRYIQLEELHHLTLNRNMLLEQYLLSTGNMFHLVMFQVVVNCILGLLLVYK